MGEKLEVRPDDLDEFAGSMRDLSWQAESAKKYVGEWIDISAGEARIYAHVKGMADQVRENLEANYAQLQTLADNSANELRASAQVYRTTDEVTAQRLDSTYGGSR